MIHRQTRMQIDEQDLRERALLGQMFSPGRWVLHAMLGVLLPIVVLAAVHAFS